MLEKEYRSLTLRLGLALLLMLLLLQVLMTVLGFVQQLLEVYLIEKAADIVYWSLYNLFYMLSYVLPIPFFILISEKKPRAPIRFDVRFPRRFVLMASASIGLTLAAGQINSLLVAPFVGEDTGVDLILDMVSPDKGYMVVPAFMMIVIIPAFCEELLFRGLVLGSLLPYGKVVAIIGSSLLFAAMHQSWGQLLYTAVAGIFLGMLYAESRSVWPSVLVHLLYNLLSFVQVFVYARIPNEWAAGKAVLGINLAVIGAGVVCAAIFMLLSGRRSKVPKQDESVLAGSNPSAQIDELPRGVAVRRFLSPSVTVYFVICLLVAMGEMIV
ncbi:MAG: CPBP family intramembrane metalloprotease [Clostridia bacterium]|nr:CPBP family intramembrane metalloprotease [Clostridia bacterium]